MNLIYAMVLTTGYIIIAVPMFDWLLDAIPCPKSETLANLLFLPIMTLIIIASFGWPITIGVMGVYRGREFLKDRKAKRLEQIDRDVKAVLEMIYE